MLRHYPRLSARLLVASAVALSLLVAPTWIALGATTTVTGLVRVPAGTGAAGALVSGGGAFATAGSDGRFALAAAPGAATLKAFPADPNGQHLVESVGLPVTVSSTPQDVTLDLRAPNVLVSVKQGASPLADVDVAAIPQAGNGNAAVDMTQAVSDAGGVLGLFLSPGPWKLLVQAPVDADPWLAQDTSKDITVVSGSVLSTTVTMAGPTLKGLVLSTTGSPVFGARVTAETDADAVQSDSDPSGHVGWVLPAGERRIWAEPVDGSPWSVLGVAALATVPASGPAPVVELRLRDRSTLPWTVVPVSVRPGGAYGSGTSRDPSLSADGSTVVFTSRAPDLLATAVSTTVDHVYRRDIAAGTTSLVDVATGGGPSASGITGTSAISGDGLTAAFTSASSDLIAGDTEGQTDVFVRNITAGATERASAVGGSGGNGTSSAPTLSGDGSAVAFLTAATNLGGSGTTLLVRRLGALATVASAGIGELAAPRLSRDGRVVVYLQRATDGSWDVVRRELAVADGAVLGSAQAPTVSGAAPAPVVSDDGSTVSWVLRTASGSTQRRWTIAGVVDVPLTPTPYGGGTGLTSLANDSTYVANGIGGAPQAFRRDGTVTDLATTGPRGLGVPILGSVSASDAAVAWGQVGIAPAGGTSVGPQVFLAKLADAAAPTWPPAAELTASSVGSTFAQLAWPAAADDVAVTGYVLSGAPGGDRSLAADITGLALTGLTPATTYDLQLVAKDAVGHSSAPLTLGLTTLAAPLTGTAPLSAVTAADGTVQLTWDVVSGATAYAVFRGTDDGPLTRVADLPAGTSSWLDTATAAGAVHKYRISTTLDGTEQVLTVVATAARTAALELTTVGVVPQLLRPGIAQLGSDVVITALGSVGRTATASVTWANADGLQTTTQLAMPATSAGAYRRTFPLADGIARVIGVTVHLVDGVGASVDRAAAPNPFDVSGVVDITLTGDDLPDLRLDRSADSLHDAAVLPLPGRSLSLPLAAALDWRFRVLGADGVEVARRGPITVERGQRVALVLDLRRAAEVRLQYQTADGTPVPGATATLLNADSSYAGYLSGSTDGTATSALRLVDGATYTLRSSVPGAFGEIADTTVTASLPGSARQVVVVPLLATGHVHGIVRNAAGDPVAGVVMTLAQPRRRLVPATSTTGPDGSFDLEATTGPAVLAAGYQGAVTTWTVDVPDGTLDRDVVLPVLQAYRVDVQVRTRQAGQPAWEGPYSLTSSRASSLVLSVTAGSAPALVGAQDAGDGTLRVFAFNAEVGTPLTVCIDGTTLQVPSGCQTLVLGSDLVPVLRLDRGYVEGVSGEVTGATGTGVQLSLVGTDGALTPVSGYRTTGAGFVRGVPGPGRYRLVVSGDSADSAEAVVDIPAGRIIDLGALVLAPPGPFRVLSTVQSPRENVLPGALVGFRAVLRNTTSVTAAVARILVPSGATLPPESLVLDGVAAVGTPVPGGVDVAVGALPARAEHVLLYSIRLGDTYDSDTLAGAVRMAFDGGTDALVDALVGVQRLTFEAPPPTTRHEITVGGIAAPGAVVRVQGNGGLLALATAGPGGAWTTPLTLPDTGAAQDYDLWAETGDGTDLRRTKPVTVIYDPDRPELIDVSLQQGETGTQVHADPRLGISHPLFSVKGGAGLIVKLTWTKPERVTDVVVHVGTGTAAATFVDGKFVASLPDFNERAGAVRVESTVLRATPVYSPRTAAQARNALPFAWQDAVIPPIDPVAIDGGFEMTMNASSPTAGDLSLVLSMTDAPDFAPNAADLATAAEAGVPVYGLELGEPAVAGDPITVTAYVPRSIFASPVATAGLRRGVSTMSLVSSVYVKIAAKVTGEDVIENTDRVRQGINGWRSSNYTDIEALYGLLGPCDDAWKAHFAVVIEREKRRQLVQDVMATGLGAFLTLAGTGVLPVFGTVIGGALSGILIDATFNMLTAKKLQEIKDAIEANCGPQPPDPSGGVSGSSAGGSWTNGTDTTGGPGGAVVDPKYLHDPSGVAYEGTRSNPIAGVTATLLQGETATGPWSFWDARDYAQTNPMPTNDIGYYGWDVPEGWWKVVWTKDGYGTAESPAMEVLPPRFNVDVGLVRLAPPVVTDVLLTAGGGIDVVFDRPMRTFTFDGALAVTRGGSPVAGAWVAVAPQPGVDDVGEVAQRVRFTPAAPLTASTAYRIDVSQTVQDYARRTMTGDVSRTLTTAPAASGVGGTNTPSPSADPSPGSSSAPTGTPTSGSPSPASCVTLRVGVPQEPALAGRPVTITVQGPAGVRTVELIGYVRPSTTYRVLRTVTLSQVGLAFVTLAPAGNARLAARQVGCAAGSSTVLSVRSVLSLSAVPVGLHVVRLSGSVLPHRYGRVVRLEVGPAAGTTSIVRTVRTDATGHYTVLVRVPAGRYKIVAKTFSDLTVMAGSSPTIFVSVR